MNIVLDANLYDVPPQNMNLYIGRTKKINEVWVVRNGRRFAHTFTRDYRLIPLKTKCIS